MKDFYIRILSPEGTLLGGIYLFQLLTDPLYHPRLTEK